MRRRDERECRVERRHNTRHVESSRAFLRSIARFCTSTDFSSNENRTEPKFERPLSNFSVYPPLRRRGRGEGGSISLDPNNNRSWNGLHLDSLVETENNRKNGAIFDYLRKIFIYVMIPFLLEIYFLECINDSNYKIRYIKFYS